MMVKLRKRRFRLLASDGRGNKVGNHYANGVCYTAGDVVESSRDLTKLFRNKFEQVAMETPLSAGTPVQTVMAGLQPQRATLPSDTVEAEGLTNPPASINTTDGGGLVDEDAMANDTTKPKAKSLGEDVTDKYPNAELVGVRVLYDKKRDGYYVVSPEDGTVLKKYKRDASVVTHLAKELTL